MKKLELEETMKDEVEIADINESDLDDELLNIENIILDEEDKEILPNYKKEKGKIRLNKVFPPDYNEFENIPLDQEIPSVTMTPEFSEIYMLSGFDKFPPANNLTALVSCARLLTDAEVKTLIVRFQEHNDVSARNRLVEHNLRLVYHFVKTPYVQQNIVSIDDALSDGTLGLMRAIDKFKITKGFKFSTYAGYWIKQMMCRSGAAAKEMVHIPVHKQADQALIRSAIINSSSMGHATPSEEYLLNYINNEKEKKNLPPMTSQQLKELLPYSTKVISVDQTISSGEVTSMLDLIDETSRLGYEDPIIKNPEQEMMVNELLNILKPTERKIVRLRYGMNDEEKKYKLQEIGDMLSLTKERIRQIQREAESKMQTYAEQLGLTFNRED